MRHDLYYDLYTKEQDYWWHVGKRAIVYGLLDRFGRKGKAAGRRALDLGCGTGLNLDHLSKLAQPVGTDYYEEALQFCRERGHTMLCKADAAELPFGEGVFDIITALDVVEHLDDDVTALCELRRVLRPGGVAVISVPAYPVLWTYWDDILGHRRRYTTRTLRAAVEKAGLEVLKVSYSNTLTLFPATGVRILKVLLHRASETRREPRVPESDFVPIPEWLNRALIAYYRLEAWALRRVNLPFGLSVVCVARRKRGT
ncbi:MAG TPA: class I SAM-dependent methyltransferase [Chloroflexia bacterium]|nr:class I SAM-dependent methyltransferase [Chloroflexia bacterium]